MLEPIQRVRKYSQIDIFKDIENIAKNLKSERNR
jgi:hypothetical protein